MKYTDDLLFLGLFFALTGSFSLLSLEPVELDPVRSSDLEESLLTKEEQKEAEAGQQDEASECKPRFSVRCLQRVRDRIRRRMWQTSEDYVELGDDLDNGGQGLSKDQQKLMNKIRAGEGIVWSLVQVGDTSFADRDGSTPLMAAAQYGRSEEANSLLGLDDSSINSQNKDGFTALMLAAMHGHVGVMGILFGFYNVIDPNLKNNDGLTALDLAIKHGQRAAIKYLLNRSKSTPQIIIDESTFRSAVLARDSATLNQLLKLWKRMNKEQRKLISRTKLLTEADKMIVATKQQLRQQKIQRGDRAWSDQEESERSLTKNLLLRQQEQIAELLVTYGATRVTPNEDSFMAAISDADPESLAELLESRKTMSREQKDAISRTKVLKKVKEREAILQQELRNLERMEEILIRYGARPQTEAGAAEAEVPSREIEIEVEEGVVWSPKKVEVEVGG